MPTPINQEYLEDVDDFSDRIKTIKSDAHRARVDAFRAILDSAYVLANLSETEQRIGELDAARKCLEKAEERIRKVSEFLEDRKHSLADDELQSFNRALDALTIRLNSLRDSIV